MLGLCRSDLCHDVTNFLNRPQRDQKQTLAGMSEMSKTYVPSERKPWGLYYHCKHFALLIPTCWYLKSLADLIQPNFVP